MNATGFAEVWKKIVSSLKPDTVVRNWTYNKRYAGSDIVIKVVSPDMIVCDPGQGNLQAVPRKDFERVWEFWGLYVKGKFARSNFTPMTRFSKYIISIFHWYEEYL